MSRSTDTHILLGQLKALTSPILLAINKGNGNCNYRLGEALNAIRDTILEQQPDERATLEKTIPPLDFSVPDEPSYHYSVSAEDATRLLLQLVYFLEPDSDIGFVLETTHNQRQIEDDV